MEHLNLKLQEQVAEKSSWGGCFNFASAQSVRRRK
jgi:hypothetical protein